MAEQRRIVPDNSVMLPAFFDEKLPYGGSMFDLSHRAQALLAAILSRAVVAYAPEALRQEFTGKVASWPWPREGAPTVRPEDAKSQVEEFFRLPIVYVPGERLAATAWSYMTEMRLAPSDSWYLACAVVQDAELWLSHAHADRFAEKARDVHNKVYLLTERRF